MTAAKTGMPHKIMQQTSVADRFTWITGSSLAFAVSHAARRPLMAEVVNPPEYEVSDDGWPDGS